MMKVLLSELPIKKLATITKINGSDKMRNRLMEMGLTDGTTLYINRVAPLGDPLEIRVRNFSLCIRKDDAKMIEVKLH